MGDAPKRIGRPAKYPGEGRRPIVALRVRGGLYEKLKEAAATSERSMSEEMERRLEHSFLVEDAVRVVRETIRIEMRAEREAEEARKAEKAGLWLKANSHTNAGTQFGINKANTSCP